MEVMDLGFLKEMRPFNIESGLDLLRRGGFVTMSWGIERIVEVRDKRGQVKGMMFRVNGYKFTGDVMLTVNGADLYEVRFYAPDGDLVETFEDVFVGDLIPQVDEYVEKQPEYNY